MWGFLREGDAPTVVPRSFPPGSQFRPNRDEDLILMSRINEECYSMCIGVFLEIVQYRRKWTVVFVALRVFVLNYRVFLRDCVCVCVWSVSDTNDLMICILLRYTH